MKITAPYNQIDTNDTWFGIKFTNGTAEVATIKKDVADWFLKNKFVIKEDKPEPKGK